MPKIGVTSWLNVQDIIVNVKKNTGMGQKARSRSYEIVDAMLEYNKQGVKNTRLSFESH